MTWAIGGLVLALLLPAAASAARDPSYPAQVQYERGANAMRAGDVAAALVFLERAVSLSPDFEEALSLYGSALLADGQNERAVEMLERAAGESPGGTNSASFYLGVASYRIQRWEDAVRYLSAAEAERTQSGQLYLYLGIAQQELGNREEARAALQRASQLDPSLQGPSEYRLGVMALDDSPEEARKHFDRVQQVAPSSELARSASGYVEKIDSGYFRPWGISASLGGGYDSNVSLEGGDSFFVSGIESGIGTGQLAGHATLLDRDKVVIDTGASADILYHGGEPANTFDQVITEAWMRAAFPIDDEMDFSIAYNFQYVWADYAPFRATHSADLQFRFSPKARNLSSQAYFRLDARNYLIDLSTDVQSFLNRDGMVKRFGVRQYVYTGDFWGWGRNSVSLGFEYRREHTYGTEYSSNGLQPNIAFGVPLPKEMLWTTSFSFEWRNFDNASCFANGGTGCEPFPVGAPTRKDRIALFATSLRIPITSSLDTDLRYVFWNRNSNYSFYEYDRNLAEVRVTYSY